MKYFLVILIFFSFSACGVTTDSSKALAGSGTNTGVGSGTGGTTTPIDTNNSGVTDANTSGSGSSSGQDPAFDTSGGAQLDPSACRSAFATAVPLQDSADSNSQRETDDNLNGISLMSLYPQTFNAADSNVIAFYKSLPLGSVLQDSTKRENIYGDNSQFIVIYDPTWINTQNNTLYVQTPKLTNKLNSCFRITIGSPIVIQKVYSNKQ